VSIAGLLLRNAQRWPGRVALREADGGREVTFTQLAQACGAVGAVLARTGATVGDRIALLGDTKFDYLVADYGVMACGLVRVPLDPALSAAELASQMRDAEARVLVCSDSRLALGREAAAIAGIETLSLEQVVTQAAARADALPLVVTAFDALASLNYTGGTSSEPKAVMLTQGSLRAAVQNIVMARGAGPGDVMLNVRPLWPIAAIVVLAHLCAGGTVVTAGGFDASRFVAQVELSGAVYTSLVPTHLVRLLRGADRNALERLHGLRAIDVGAAAIPPETFAELVAAIGPRIGVLYGLTEAPWSCYLPPVDVVGAGGVDPERMRRAGRPLFGCDLAIRGEGGDAAAGEEGEILLRGAHVMKGYWKRPDLTAAALRDGWLHTGDLGFLDESGRLCVTGRIKEVIRSGGKSVVPGEVEQALCSHPDVSEAAVLGVPDREWGERVVAVVVMAAGRALDEAALAAHCAQALSSHKRPRVIRAVDALPRSHYGKVQKGKLRELFAQPTDA
jgi:acyl-CoA synthetase (AMP-forming)/AMP-acid ligase II